MLCNVIHLQTHDHCKKSIAVAQCPSCAILNFNEIQIQFIIFILNLYIEYMQICTRLLFKYTQCVCVCVHVHMHFRGNNQSINLVLSPQNGRNKGYLQPKFPFIPLLNPPSRPSCVAATSQDVSTVQHRIAGWQTQPAVALVGVGHQDQAHVALGLERQVLRLRAQTALSGGPCGKA